MKAINDIVTEHDNETHDVVRWVMFVNAVALVPVLLLGVGFYLYGYIESRAFDMQTFFTAVLTYEGGVGTLLTTGAAAIFFKKSTEADGSVTETASITRAQGER